MSMISEFPVAARKLVMQSELHRNVVYRTSELRFLVSRHYRRHELQEVVTLTICSGSTPIHLALVSVMALRPYLQLVKQ